tara:strand:- start:6 stop:557 length:552 start_codon:yes stop_codon:yes gene_type:complete
MATRKIRIRGNNHAVNSAATVTFDGVEIFSGALTAEVIDESDVWSGEGTNPVAIVEFEYNNSDDTQETEHSLRIEITAGQIRVGQLWIEATSDAAVVNSYPENKFPAVDLNGDGTYYYVPGDLGVYGDGSESALPERTNILINDAEPISIGYEGNYAGQQFLVSAGDTFACTVRVPKILEPKS